MTNANFTHIHASGRYDTPAKDFTDAINAYSKSASIITLTEVGAEARENLIRKVSGFGSVTGDLSGMDDCSIMYDKSVWTLVHGETFTVTKSTYFQRSGHETSPAAVAFAVLRHRATGYILLVGSGHLASHVEEATGLTKSLPRRAAAWTGQQRGYKDRWNYLAGKYHVDGLLITADWNLNIRKAWVKALFKTLQPGMRMVWGDTKLPTAGTAGTRIIDVSFIRGDIKATVPPQILPHNASSDHTPYGERFTIAV